MTAADRQGKRVTVHVPDEPPVLTRQVSRILLEMLIEKTEIEVLDAPRGGEVW
ncbi:hypothetical protein AB0A63_07585 [Lentzea sp. NPDC042327]|uniref:hypothetical protein n=1 Tax=Lentzea sp. NPDC042327 TaxID=3154801 RepID=UPI0033D67B7D